MSLVHGIELGEDKKPVWLRFGIFNLLGHLLCSNSAEPSVQDWQQRFRSEAFRHQVRHFQQCFWKFDLAAGHVARCRDTVDGVLGRYSERIKLYQDGKIAQPPDPLSDPDRLVMDEINSELPVFLDAMLFYLRIQADSYAQLVTFFYEGRDTGRIDSDSFRRQFNWFTKRNRSFDPEYASVLNANRKWFDRLAASDEPKGLRDVVTHHSGMLAVGWAKPEVGPIEPRTALFRAGGIVEENVFRALQEITAGWYAFLDCAWHHFVPRLTQAGVLLTMSARDLEKTRYVNCVEEELRGLWVYPTFTNTEQ